LFTSVFKQCSIDYDVLIKILEILVFSLKGEERKATLPNLGRGAKLRYTKKIQERALTNLKIEKQRLAFRVSLTSAIVKDSPKLLAP